MTRRAEKNANFEVDVKLTLLRLSTPVLFKLLASSPFSGLATYFSSMLFGGGEGDELESEAGECLTSFVWS